MLLYVCVLLFRFEALTCFTSSSMSQHCCSDFPLLYRFYLSFVRERERVQSYVNKRKSVLCMSFQVNDSGIITSFVFFFFFSKTTLNLVTTWNAQKKNKTGEWHEKKMKLFQEARRDCMMKSCNEKDKFCSSSGRLLNRLCK